MFKINGKNYKVIGIKNDRVLFQLVEKGDYYDNVFKSLKINIDSTGYFIKAPKSNWNEHNKIYLDEILKCTSMLQEILNYYKKVKK